MFIVYLYLPKIRRYLIYVVSLQSNYDTRFCGLCPNANNRVEENQQSRDQCPTTNNKRLLCWDENNCQKGMYGYILIVAFG